MNISRIDAFWNILATILRIGSSMIILPLIMHYISTEEYGLWTIFLTYGSLITLIDFGFSNSFTRNVTYIFSGAKELKKTGFVEIEKEQNIDYNLLKGIIKAMHYYYAMVAIIALITIGIIGTIQLHIVMTKNHWHNTTPVYTAWSIYICLISYQLYTLYYESLLIGRGLIKRRMQIIIIAQVVYLILVSICIIKGLGLLSMVLGLVFSMTINRWLSKKVFFDKHIKQQLKTAIADNYKQLIKIFAHNSIKVGLATLAGFFATRASILIGSIYLPLTAIASYGLSKQLIDTLTAVAMVWFNTYYPKITFFRVKSDIEGTKRIYLKSWLFFVGIFGLGALILVLFGNWALVLIQSKTLLLPALLLTVMVIISLLESNHGMAAGLLLAENKVPFLKATLVCGVLTVCFLFLFIQYFHWATWGMILAPGFAQLYQDWKWPHEIIKKYQFKINDLSLLLKLKK